MRQIQDFGDDRSKGWCVYCGGPRESRDHLPSRVLLDRPYPDNLPTVPACISCNNKFSKDEAYLACLLECVISSGNASALDRHKVERIFSHSPRLADELAATYYEDCEVSGYAPNLNRVKSVIVKLARGHAAYDNSEPRIDEPTSLSMIPLLSLTQEERSQLELEGLEGTSWPEVGSRAMQRLVEGHDLTIAGWTIVQSGMYRYRLGWSGGFRVQMILREYLAAEVLWA